MTTPETTDQAEPTTPDAPAEESINEVIKRLGPAAWLGIAWSVVPLIMGLTLLAKMGFARRMLIGTTENPGLEFSTGITIFIAIFIISAGLGILPSMYQSILAGFAFGIKWGFPASVAGFAGASIIGYFIARFVARDRVESELQNHPKATIIRDAFLKHGKLRALLILTLIRVPQTSPFSMTNYAMSVAGVRFVPYLIATVIGMAPRTFVYVWIGAQADNWDEVQKPVWLIIGGILFTIALIVGLGKLANKALEAAIAAGDLPPEPTDQIDNDND